MTLFLLIALSWIVASLVCAPLLGRILHEVRGPRRAPSVPSTTSARSSWPGPRGSRRFRPRATAR